MFGRNKNVDLVTNLIVKVRKYKNEQPYFSFHSMLGWPGIIIIRFLLFLLFGFVFGVSADDAVVGVVGPVGVAVPRAEHRDAVDDPAAVDPEARAVGDRDAQ